MHPTIGCAPILQSIQTVDYENELELMVVTSVSPKEDGYEGYVHLHDNTTGKMLKHVCLEEPWAEVAKTSNNNVIHLSSTL